MNEPVCNAIDVSHFQGKIDWQQVGEDKSIRSVIMKASEGAQASDALFVENWQGAKAAGLRCGAYHFFRPKESFLHQADLFLGQLKKVGYDGTCDLPPVLDCEVTDGVSNSAYAFALGHLLELLVGFLNPKPMIYTAPGFWEQVGNPNFSAYPLWLAEYTDGTPHLPAHWTSYAMWQFSQKGTVPGIAGHVDLDLCQLPDPSTTALQPSALAWF